MKHYYFYKQNIQRLSHHLRHTCTHAHTHTHRPQNDISDETLMQFSSRRHLHTQKAHVMCFARSELFSIFAFDTSSVLVPTVMRNCGFWLLCLWKMVSIVEKEMDINVFLVCMWISFTFSLLSVTLFCILIISTSLVYNGNATCVLVEYASCKISVLGCSLTIFILSITGVLLQL